MGAVNPPFVPRFGVGAPTGNAPPGALYFDVSFAPYASYVGNGGRWHEYGPGGSPQVAIVQTAALTDNNHVTFGVAPQSGNKLIAFMTTGGQGPGTTQSGWTRDFDVVSGIGSNHGYIYSKTCGGGESTTQSPSDTGAQFGCMGMFEIVNFTAYDAPSLAEGINSGANVSVDYTTAAVNELLIGMDNFFTNTVTGFMSMASGATQVGKSNDGNRKGILFANECGAADDYSYVVTFAGGSTQGALSICIK